MILVITRCDFFEWIVNQSETALKNRAACDMRRRNLDDRLQSISPSCSRRTVASKRSALEHDARCRRRRAGHGETAQPPLPAGRRSRFEAHQVDPEVHRHLADLPGDRQQDTSEVPHRVQRRGAAVHGGAVFLVHHAGGEEHHGEAEVVRTVDLLHAVAAEALGARSVHAENQALRTELRPRLETGE